MIPEDPDMGVFLTYFEDQEKRKTKFETIQSETCLFDFKEIYGELGEGFAECHHKKPVSQLKNNEKTKLDDLAILCANCHRMIHRSKPWKTIDELKKILKK